MVNVGIRSNLTNAVTRNLDWSYAFEPSIAITTGRIDKLGLDIRSFREPLQRAVREVMTKSIHTNFAQQGRPEAWEELSEDTWRRRASEGWSGGGILLKSGALQRVASQQNIWTISTTSATIRDLPQKVWYGKVHQQGAEKGAKVTSSKKTGGFTAHLARGGKAGSGTSVGGSGRGYVSIPQRQFLIIQEEDHEAIVEIFRKWLAERVAKHTGRM
jgi:phage gpG-like protein